MTISGRERSRVHELPNNSMQRPALRAAVDADRCATRSRFRRCPKGPPVPPGESSGSNQERPGKCTEEADHTCIDKRPGASSWEPPHDDWPSW